MGNSKFIETADWRKRQGATTSPGPVVGMEKPGFKQQPVYSTNSANSAEPTQEDEKPTAANVPAVDNTAPANTGAGAAPTSDAVARAQQMLDEHLAKGPGTYQSTWQEQLNEMLGQILNREKFSYDVNADALYRQMAEQYTMRGQQAMMDTMGQAAALTGGYGNSYALGAGQQAYQGYLQQLNDVVPDLYQMALSNYQMEGDALMDKFGALGAMEDQAYSRFQDDQNAYYTMLDQLLNQYYAERDFAYEQGRDQVADDQWQAEFDEDKRRYDQEWELAVGEYTGQNGGNTGASGGSGGSGGGDPTENLDGVATEDAEATLSENGQNFLNNLPYLHAGGDVEGWKRTVAGQLYRGLENGTLSETDVALIALQLGLENVVPDDKDYTGSNTKDTGKGNKKSSGGAKGGGGGRFAMIAMG